MARLFNGTSARISAASAPGNVGANARTIAFFFSTTNNLSRTTLYYEGDASGLLTIEMDGSPTFKVTTINFPGTGTFSSAASISDNTLYHVLLTYSGSAGNIYINGSSSGSGLATALTTTTTNFSFGGHPSNIQYLTGWMAEVCKYDVVLTADEITSLSKGVTPLKVRPQSLAFYAPLVRNVVDMKGLALTDNGPTTHTDHPRTYR